MKALSLAIARGLPAWRPRLTDLRGWVVPLLMLALLETLVRTDVLPSHQMPAPSQVAQTLYLLAQSGELWRHLSASLLRVGAGFVIGAALAVVIGTWVGLSRRAEAYLEPTFQALRAIPSLAWVPLLLLWLGIDETPKIVLIALGAFFPVYLALLAGIRNIDRKLVEVGQLYGLPPLTLVRRILLPAALPSLFTGLRGALSLSWMFLVARRTDRRHPRPRLPAQRWPGNLATGSGDRCHPVAGAARQTQRQPAQGLGKPGPALA